MQDLGHQQNLHVRRIHRHGTFHQMFVYHQCSRTPSQERLFVVEEMVSVIEHAATWPYSEERNCSQQKLWPAHVSYV